MLLERLENYLESTDFGLSYVRDDPRLEIWVKDKEWLPILVSKVHGERYTVSWGDIEYQSNDEEKTYRYVLKIFSAIHENRKAILGNDLRRHHH